MMMHLTVRVANRNDLEGLAALYGNIERGFVAKPYFESGHTQ